MRSQFYKKKKKKKREKPASPAAWSTFTDSRGPLWGWFWSWWKYTKTLHLESHIGSNPEKICDTEQRAGPIDDDVTKHVRASASPKNSVCSNILIHQQLFHDKQFPHNDSNIRFWQSTVVLRASLYWIAVSLELESVAHPRSLVYMRAPDHWEDFRVLLELFETFFLLPFWNGPFSAVSTKKTLPDLP